MHLGDAKYWFVFISLILVKLFALVIVYGFLVRNVNLLWINSYLVKHTIRISRVYVTSPIVLYHLELAFGKFEGNLLTKMLIWGTL